jgi:hypothetical protein
MLAAAGGG